MRILEFSGACLVAAFSLPAQTPTVVSHGIADVTMCYDEVRDRLVCFDNYGEGTFEWDGSRWGRIQPGSTAYLRSPVWFPPLGQILALSGGALVGYDGHDVGVVHSVPWTTNQVSLTVDQAAGRVYSLVNVSPSHALWTWTGGAWQYLSTLQGPLTLFGIAVDETSGALVAVALNLLTHMYETWTWDGIGWTQANVRSERVGPICYDPVLGQIVSFGDGETASWNGSTWNVTPTPGARAGAETLVFDRSNGRMFAHTWSEDVVSVRDSGGWTIFDGPHVHVELVRPTYDSGRGRLVLFGGDPLGRSTLAEWDGVRWQRAITATAPSPRYRHAQVYDAARQQTLVFGGSGVTTTDTWLWDGSSWQQYSGPSPSARTLAAATYDDARQRVVMVGGLGATGNMSDHWEWDGATWTQIAATTPMGNNFAVLGHDRARNRSVLVNGLGDTWEYDGVAWSMIVANGPKAHFNNSELFWNPVAQRVQGDLGFPNSEQRHEWDGAAWTVIGVSTGAYVFDEARGVLLAYRPDELLVESATPAAATAYGSGCGAAGATIATTLTPFGMPVTGNAAFELDVRAAATQSPVLIAFGASQTQIPLGAGCDLLLQGSFGALFGLTDAQGLWHLPLPMPANLALRGYPFVAQAAVTDASAPLGFALTQGLQLVVGD